MITVAAIVAMDETRVIGIKGALPWHLPEDMAHFRQLTHGGVVIMGRKTWDSLPVKFKPLPGRVNLVVSRQAPNLILPPGVLQASSPEEGLLLATQAARQRGCSKVWIIGGAELYNVLLDSCDEVHLTLVRGKYEGDAWFPPFEERFGLISENGVNQDHQRCFFKVYARTPCP